MRLTKQHEGKFVRVPDGETIKVLKIGEDRFFGDGQISGEGSWPTQFPWEIVEPKKKPSQRINEIVGETRSDPEWQERAIEAILIYLDEQEETK